MRGRIVAGLCGVRAGAFALAYRISQLRILLLPAALGLSACQTIDDAPTSNSWNAVPLPKVSEVQRQSGRTSGAPLLADTAAVRPL